MKKPSIPTPTANPALQELYGAPIMGPIPQGEIDWKTVALYAGGACLVAGVFAYCIHLSNQKNMEIWVLQVEKTNEEHSAALAKRDLVIHDLVHEIKFQYQLMKPSEKPESKNN